MEWYLALGIAFAVVGVAELADKTQLVTISQACRHPFAPVLAGSALALVVVTAVGVVVGALLGMYIQGWLISIVAGALFVAFGAWLLLKRHRARAGAAEATDGACPDEPPTEDDDAECPTGGWRPFASTFGLVAVAELGDKTQLTVVALAGDYGQPLAVFIGASLALVAISAAAVWLGAAISRRFSLERIDLVAATLFLVLGAAMLLDGAGLL